MPTYLRKTITTQYFISKYHALFSVQINKHKTQTFNVNLSNIKYSIFAINNQSGWITLHRTFYNRSPITLFLFGLRRLPQFQLQLELYVYQYFLYHCMYFAISIKL